MSRITLSLCCLFGLLVASNRVEANPILGHPVVVAGGRAVAAKVAEVATEKVFNVAAAAVNTQMAPAVKGQSAEVHVKQLSFMSKWIVAKKTLEVDSRVWHGNGRGYVIVDCSADCDVYCVIDMSEMTAANISLDAANKILTITAPKITVETVSIDEDSINWKTTRTGLRFAWFNQDVKDDLFSEARVNLRDSARKQVEESMSEIESVGKEDLRKKYQSILDAQGNGWRVVVK